MDSFSFGNKVSAKADVNMKNLTVKNLWNGFSSHGSTIVIENGLDNTFVIGEAALPQLLKNDDYSINVQKTGVAVIAHDYDGLVRGYTALLRFIEPVCLDKDNEQFSIKSFNANKSYSLKRRMIHYCVFPETSLLEIKREIRLAGTLHYTHVVLEFWGMFKYDCLKELSWPNAFSKEDVADLIREIRELGMEPIPFLNHLGHASMSRVNSGKHVVLDQNPRLQGYFMPEGWEWNIYSEKTIQLLKTMRSELCEVFGKGEYFHIGFDEANMITAGDDMSSYLHDLTNEVEKEGRKPMLWADMLISKDEISDDNSHEYYAACKTAEDADKVLHSLSQNSVLVDWQYNTKHAPLKSFSLLKEKGYNVMEAPWFDYENCDAAVDTLTKRDGYGLMMTTWHDIIHSYGATVYVAKLFGAPQFEWSFEGPFLQWSGALQTETATLLRKVSFEKLCYEQTGYCKYQTGYTPS